MYLRLDKTRAVKNPWSDCYKIRVAGVFKTLNAELLKILPALLYINKIGLVLLEVNYGLFSIHYEAGVNLTSEDLAHSKADHSLVRALSKCLQPAVSPQNDAVLKRSC